MTAAEDADLLALGDWRRRVASLYAEVRELAATDPEAAWRHWRAVRDELYRTHDQSPLQRAVRATFEGRYYAYDAALRFERVAVRPSPPPAPGALSLSLPNSGADGLAFRRIGTVDLPLPVGQRQLSLFWMEGYAGGLFLPFRDTTSDDTTYGAGRYLIDAAKSADLGGGTDLRTLTLDFNFAYQPSCAFDPRWACPLAPPENRLDTAIEAGERLT